MLNKTSIGAKIHIPIIVMMLLGAGIISYNGFKSLEQTSADAYKTFSSNMQTYVNQGILERSQVSLTNAINISFNSKVIEALKQNDRNIAIENLKNISESFKHNSDYGDIKIQIHDSNINSFLRHWNEDKYGDNLKGFRDSLIVLKKTKKPLVSIEAGRAGLLVRGLSPIIYNDSYIGSVEFIQGFDSLVKTAKTEKNYDIVILAYNTHKGIKKFSKNIYKVGDMFLSQKFNITNKNLFESLNGVDLKALEQKIDLEKNGFFITSVVLKNHKNEKVGYAVIATDISRVDVFVNEARKTLLNQIYVVIFLDVILLAFLLYFLQTLIKKPVDRLVMAIKQIEKSLNDEDLKDLYNKNKLDIENYDEIGMISKTINVLLKNMAQTFSELKKSNKVSSEYMRAVDAGSIVSKSDINGIITYVNDTLCLKTGYKREELMGKPHNIFRHPNTPRKTFTTLWDTIQSGEIYHGLFKNIKKDGTSFYANITIVPIQNENNEIVEYIALRDDVTELVDSKKELKRNFLTDSLTSFGNRFKLLEDLELKENTYLAIIDIQSFKEVNDFYGYKFGDIIIRDLANRMFDCFSGYGFDVYRLGGDEFSILTDNTTITKDDFFELVKKFMNEIKIHNFEIEDNIITLQLTCGISYNNKNLFTEADIAHKHAKKSNIEIVVYDENINTDEEYKKNLKWTTEIKNAIEDNRIKAFFQPIVNTKTDEIQKYETLMRLIKTDGEEVSPFFFLDIAKKTRLYKDLTKIVVKQAFEKFSGTKYRFSVNLSAEDIIIHDVSDWFFDLAREYKVNNQVVIEIVESEGIESFDTVNTFISSAKENGMKIAIDDFGTGYSNFEYLIKLNTDYLKIDGSLIKAIDTNEKIYSVVETIVAFAKKNNIKTIGEFVATESLYKKIKELDIDFGQGYYLGKPLADLVD